MRLIDADALMDTIRQHDYILKDFYNGTDKGMFTTGIEQAVSEQPTIDAVPVVRCKDCKYYREGYCYSDNFILSFEEVKPDWFCADGEKRGQ